MNASTRAQLLTMLDGLSVECDVPMSKRTTFGIGGPADVVVTVANEADVVRVLASASACNEPVFVLGGGSNLLVGDLGIRGVTLVLVGELSAIQVSDDFRTIEVGCGATYPRLTRAALDAGWPSAVGWFGTPGQVGGALIMNAGTRLGEIGDTVVEVNVATADGLLVLPRAECGFAYRTSRFPGGGVLTRARLRCDTPQNLEVERLSAMAQEQLKRRHQTQPKQRSAGSIFKNPDGDFAGRLIESCGLKGETVGGAQISTVHANFIVNLGTARAADVLALADMAIARVRDACGVTLSWEVRRVGVFA